MNAMQVNKRRPLKAFFVALPMIAVAAIIFAVANAIGPTVGFVTPIIVMVGIVVFLYFSGSRQ